MGARGQPIAVANDKAAKIAKAAHSNGTTLREEAELRAEALGLKPYDAMMEQYDPGSRAADIDPVFAELKAFFTEVRSELKKVTWPGRKQVWRRFGSNGRMAGDVLWVEEDDHPGERLIQGVMLGGRRLHKLESLTEIRARAAHNIEALPEPLRRLDPDATYPVTVSEGLVRLAAEVDKRLV